MADNSGGHATLYDFRDLDLLFKIGKDRQWDTESLAHALGQPENARGVGSRLSWMRRFGMVERTSTGLWYPTPAAQRVTEARMRASQAKTMEDLPDELMVEVMSRVTQRYLHGTPMLASMLRREFAFGTKPR